ncbi:MAG: hypothetical protein AAFP90_07695, partial [Planctomycetota bacterium]
MSIDPQPTESDDAESCGDDLVAPPSGESWATRLRFVGHRRGTSNNGERRIRIQGRSKRRLLFQRLSDRRVLATITGAVYDDVNDSRRFDSDESGFEGRVVYLDNDLSGDPSLGDAIEFTDAEGRFTFDDVPAGGHVVALYNGTLSQSQTSPVRPVSLEKVDLTDLTHVAAAEDPDSVIAVEDSGIQRVSLIDGTTESISTMVQTRQVAQIDDGTLIGVIGTHQLFIALPGQAPKIISPILQQGESGIASLAVNDQGQGLLVFQPSPDNPAGTTNLRSISVDENMDLVVSDTQLAVAADTTVHSSPDGRATLIASPTIPQTVNGILSLSLFSHDSGSLVNNLTVNVGGIDSVLDYDDASGLVL